MRERLASVSVDLDGARCYREIHGLSASGSGRPDPILSRTVPRFAELFEDLGIRATFFVIGRDLEDAGFSAALRDLVARGHEVANHSLDHRYDLVRLDDDAMRAQVATASRRIAETVGIAPTGFRAPGYTVSDRLLSVVADCGLEYDSSVFPCPVYWSAKAVARTAIALRGRTSHSILDSPCVLRAPVDPYRVGRPYHDRGQGLPELPIGVTAGPRLPFIGTLLTTVGPTAARWLARAMRTRPHVNLELHAIDLADAGEDGLETLARHQPDLRIGRDRKERALRVAMGQLREDGARFVPLVQAAQIITAPT
jgi:peptidoglycan-N-acetylglucosamine deacetylase